MTTETHAITSDQAQMEPFTVVGHRGAMSLVLENTIESFTLAEQLGCHELELDIRPTRDGRIVVVHDRDLDRLVASAEGQGLGDVSALTWSEIRAVQLRDGHRVHTLEEVYEATSARLQVEIKDPDVVPLLVEFAAKFPDVGHRVRLTGFDPEALVRARDLVPQIPRGIIVHELPVEGRHPEGLDSLLERTGSSVFHCGWNGLTSETVREQQHQGRRVHVWPVDSPSRMQQALELGADGTTVDDPEQAMDWYRGALDRRA